MTNLNVEEINQLKFFWQWNTLSNQLKSCVCTEIHNDDHGTKGKVASTRREKQKRREYQ